MIVTFDVTHNACPIKSKLNHTKTIGGDEKFITFCLHQKLSPLETSHLLTTLLQQTCLPDIHPSYLHPRALARKTFFNFFYKRRHSCILGSSVDGNALERAYRVDTLVAIVARLRIQLTLVDVYSREEIEKQKLNWLSNWFVQKADKSIKP